VELGISKVESWDFIARNSGNKSGWGGESPSDFTDVNQLGSGRKPLSRTQQLGS